MNGFDVFGSDDEEENESISVEEVIEHALYHQILFGDKNINRSKNNHLKRSGGSEKISRKNFFIA